MAEENVALPKIATPEMLEAFLGKGFKADDFSYGLKVGDLSAGYAAMLAAAPTSHPSRAEENVAELKAENERLTRDLRTVQNAAKTIAAAQGTELEHRRQNGDYDHKLRAEHQSLIDRDALMTEALERAEAENERLREALSFYADPSRYNGPNQKPEGYDAFAPEPDYPYRWDVTRDGGSLARAALSQEPRNG